MTSHEDLIYQNQLLVRREREHLALIKELEERIERQKSLLAKLAEQLTLKKEV